MKFSDYVDINPRTLLQRGIEAPFLGMEGLTPGRKSARPNQRRVVSGGGARFQPRDTLFARITPCLQNGKIAMYSGAETGFGSTEFYVFRAKSNVADPDYVYYFALGQELRATAEKSMAGASGRQRADAGAIADFKCVFPKLQDQQRASAMLAAYDDLIERNIRRIEVLQEMGRALFCEWFIDFRFPGCSKTPAGEIPRGWQKRNVPECIEINPRVVVPKHGEKPFVPMASLSESSMVIDEIESRSGNSGAKFKNGDTLLARITPCLENGKTGFVNFLPTSDDVAFGSTEFIVLRSKTLTPEFVYLLARNDKFRAHAIKSMSGASGRQRVQDRCFDTFIVPQPPKELLDRFSRLAEPSFSLIKTLAMMNINLRKTRDLLLPSVLAGKVRPIRGESK